MPVRVKLPLLRYTTAQPRMWASGTKATQGACEQTVPGTATMPLDAACPTMSPLMMLPTRPKICPTAANSAPPSIAIQRERP